jgi:hypothetical protein
MMTQPENQWKRAIRRAWLPGVLIIGLAARFWAGTGRPSYDFESYQMVVGLVEQGRNVYAETARYNYGPVWFHILHLLDWSAGHDPVVFRRVLIGFLSAVDAGIFWVLWRKFGRVAATLFFWNPVSVLITGYQNQFDNLAILLGLWAVLILGDDFEKPADRRKIAGLVVLGFSLMTKHLLFAFPLWLAVKQTGRWQKCVILLVPAAIFLLGFAPYWPGGRAGIVEHVLLYASKPTGYFYKMIVPSVLQRCLSPAACWLGVLGVLAVVYRRRPALESLLLYTCALVAAAPATANQYFAIPSAFTSVFVNIFSIDYTIVATGHLLTDADGLDLLKVPLRGTADMTVFALVLALVWVTWHRGLLDLLKQCRHEIYRQLEGKD